MKRNEFDFVMKKETECEYSGHICQKHEFWKYAESIFGEWACPHVCCRKCTNVTCGARCKGAFRDEDKN